MRSPLSLPHRHLATVSIGSNQGNRLSYIVGSVQWLLSGNQTRLWKISSVYETEPFGFKDQEWFLNCVAQVETLLGMKAFFRLLQDAEAFFDRERTERWGPRTLDIDLLFFDDVVHREEKLSVPHPGIPNRRFVLEPLCEILPDLVHPVLQLPVRALLERVEDPSRVLRVGNVPDLSNF